MPHSTRLAPDFAADYLHRAALLVCGGITDGQYPCCGLIFDSAGNLCGSAGAGWDVGAGIVFKLALPVSSGGDWNRECLACFGPSGAGKDGDYPEGGLIFGKWRALWSYRRRKRRRWRGIRLARVTEAHNRYP